MHSTEVQAKPLSSWKALGWALLYFWFFSTLLQAIIYISGYSGTNGIRDSLLFSSLWLIPVFLFPKRIKIIAAVIGVVLWTASLAALCYYVIYGQEFSQSVLFVMFETNTNEASEYLSQYFSLKIVLIALAYTAVAVLLWTRLRPVYIPKPWRYVVSFALLYGLILHPIAMNTFIKNKPFEKTLDNLASRMEPAAPWQFLTGYYQYRQQLNSLTKLLNENNALPPLANFKDESGNEPRTLVLVIGESTQRGRMSLYGYPRETTPELDALHKTDPNLTVFNNVVTSRPYTIEILQQALTFANEKNPDLYLTQPSLMNMMKQAGYKTFWITNQQTMTARNTMLTVFSRQTDKQYYMNQQRTQSAREYDTNVLKPFQDVLYVAAGGWNFPQWKTPATTFSVLFGKQQLGFSVVQWDGKQYQNLAKQHVARRGPRIGSFLLQTLNEMQMQPQEQQTARLIVASLLSHCRDLLGSQIQTASRSQALFEAIRDYIDERYASALTRESVAQAFYISPNYLSHLFQKTGAIGFNEYLNHTRLEHAKTLLKGYDLKVKEVAHACGFVDSNYFCRLFRKNTEHSPSEYRRQYHSQLTEKPTTPE